MTFFAPTLLAAADDQEVIKLDSWLIFIGVTQAIIFVLQLFVFGYQAWKLHQTVKAAAQQGGDMTRSADAMEKFAASAAIASKAATESVATTKETMTRLLRAYLCVNFGAAAFQNSETGSKFELNLQLINAGQTPGYKVGYRAYTEVFPFPLPQDFAFSLPEVPANSESTLGHGQHTILTGLMHRLCSAEEITEIKSGSKRLYIYGTVTYEDVYNISRYTNFCFSIFWLSNSTSMAQYTKRHNDAT
jgi:hypothetical protein